MSLIKHKIWDKLFDDTIYRQQKLVAMQKVLASPEKVSSQELVEAWVICGEIYSHNNQPDLVIKSYLKAIEIIHTLNDELLLGEGYFELGWALSFCKVYSEAITYFKKALTIFSNLENTPEIMKTLKQLTLIYRRLEEKSQERHYLNMGINLPDIEPVDKAFFLERLAWTWKSSQGYKKAIELYEQALTLLDAEDYRRGWDDSVKYLAELYHKSGDETEAEKVLKRWQRPKTKDLLQDLKSPTEMKQLDAINLLFLRVDTLDFDLISVLEDLITNDPGETVKKFAQICLNDLRKSSENR